MMIIKEGARERIASELKFVLIIIKSIFVDFVFGLFGDLLRLPYRSYATRMHRIKEAEITVKTVFVAIQRYVIW